MNGILNLLSRLSMPKIIGVGIGLMALYYFMLFNDGSQLQAQIVGLQGQIAQEEVKKKETDKAIQEEALVKQEVGSLAEKFEEASRRLPSDLNSADVIRSIQDVVKKSGCKIKSLKPLDPKKSDILEELPIGVTVEGSFGELTLFIYYVSQTQRIIQTRDFKISRPTDARGSTLQLDGQIVTYRYMPEEKKNEATPGAETAPKTN